MAYSIQGRLCRTLDKYYITSDLLTICEVVSIMVDRRIFFYWHLTFDSTLAKIGQFELPLRGRFCTITHHQHTCGLDVLMRTRMVNFNDISSKIARDVP